MLNNTQFDIESIKQNTLENSLQKTFNNISSDNINTITKSILENEYENHVVNECLKNDTMDELF